MELVIDANVLISALIKDSHTRHFLILSGNTFYVPEFVFEEINEHMDELKEKIVLSEYEIRDILEQIITLGNIKIIPSEEYRIFEEKVKSITPDFDDIAYVALALKLKCSIWSNDKDLKNGLKLIKVYNSEEILNG